MPNGKRDGPDAEFIAAANNATLSKLAEETRKFRDLCDLHSLKVANRNLQQDINRVRADIERSQGELRKLLMKIEDFEGAYQNVQDTIHAMRNAPNPRSQT